MKHTRQSGTPLKFLKTKIHQVLETLNFRLNALYKNLSNETISPYRKIIILLATIKSWAGDQELRISRTSPRLSNSILISQATIFHFETRKISEKVGALISPLYLTRVQLTGLRTQKSKPNQQGSYVPSGRRELPEYGRRPGRYRYGLCQKSWSSCLSLSRKLVSCLDDFERGCKATLSELESQGSPGVYVQLSLE